MQKQTILRYAIWTLWFFLVPALFAVVVTQWCSSSPELFGELGGWVREQQVPAGIVLFTLAEMSLYSLRYFLPGGELMSVAGMKGLSRELRRDIEAAHNLLGEATRIQSSNERAIAADLASEPKEKLSASLDQLREAIAATPFNAELFRKNFDTAAGLVDQHLAPWRKSEAREYIESVGIAVIIALLLRAVVVEAFKIPSGSMLPTLQINDHIFVNKFDYGPTLPLTDIRLMEDMPPKRGDVIVFEFPDVPPGEDGQDYIKRVIALPGDTLEVDEGHPIINGWRVPSCFVGMYHYGKLDLNNSERGELFVEFLGESSHLTLYEENVRPSGQGPFHVAAGEVWVMGDNRHNSHDSRMWRGGKGGGVPFANIQGRAMFVWLPWSRAMVPVMGAPELPQGMPELTAGIAKCLARRPKVTTPPAPKRR